MGDNGEFRQNPISRLLKVVILWVALTQNEKK